jgi:trigger factor
MDIKKKDVDALNAVVTVVISKDDYQDKVTKVLNNYKKNSKHTRF